jgi:hypothetical protein
MNYSSSAKIRADFASPTREIFFKKNYCEYMMEIELVLISMIKFQLNYYSIGAQIAVVKTTHKFVMNFIYFQFMSFFFNKVFFSALFPLCFISEIKARRINLFLSLKTFVFTI